MFSLCASVPDLLRKKEIPKPEVTFTEILFTTYQTYSTYCVDDLAHSLHLPLVLGFTQHESSYLFRVGEQLFNGEPLCQQMGTVGGRSVGDGIFRKED